ncbi:hypothetical protein KOI35_28185 [Actinoplanes bogorensis]|uniref:Lipoprotein n=1 Tax=Paractinoplanes bogorensis TaxID=1610840 RepID=A0ABS5YVB9_9ACTN|nr:hypothetical protein [Actinoplanes bogorensis]MBU2667397.1 hypothetical protein [Actinoplanes bogorensis]
MRRSSALVVAAVAMTVLSACGSSGSSSSKESQTDAQVATLQSAAPEKSVASKAPQRPRERIDGTAEDFEALLAPFNKCLKEHGVKSVEAKRAADTSQAGAAPVAGTEAYKLDEAYRVCEEQYYPLPPWEKDPANPEARDFAVAVVKCLKGKGIEYVEVSDDGISIALGGDQNDQRSITRGMDLAPVCEREVAAKK